MSSNIEELLHLRPVLVRTSGKKREEEKVPRLLEGASGPPSAPHFSPTFASLVEGSHFGVELYVAASRSV